MEDGRMKLRFLFILTSLVIAACGMTYGESVYVDHVDGLAAPDAVITGGEITFHIAMAAPESNHKGITNGWRGYSWTAASSSTPSRSPVRAVPSSPSRGPGRGCWRRGTPWKNSG